MFHLRLLRPLLCLSLLAGAAVATAADRPNVLLIYIDDLKPMTRDYGQAHMQTPHFDRLAAEGLRFENAYCQVPTCGASRASLMTSLYPTVRRFPDFLTWAERDAPGQPTLPQRFKEAGYVTISNGKVFHHAEDTNERSWSEPAWRPETSGTTFYNDETAAFMETVTETRTIKGAKKPQKKLPMFEKGKVDAMETHDGLIAQRTMEDLERLAEGDQPFFLVCGFAKPHMPFFSPEPSYAPYPLEAIPLAENRERPSPMPQSFRQVREQFAYLPMTHDFSRLLDYNSDDYHRHMRQGYYASVTHADDLMGRVLDKLDALDLRENTVVVVIGDHGWLLGEHNEWAKNQLLPEALRTAMWMTGPGIEKGAAVPSFVEFVDIHPTLCELAGVAYDADSIHGRSFAPVLKNPNAIHRDHAYTRFEFGDAITTDDHFLVRWNSKANGKETLLMDRKADPLGRHNVAGEAAHAGVVEELDRKVQAKISAALDLPAAPQVVGEPIDLEAEVEGPKLNGVVLSHGGLRFGYALHFVKGVPTLSVRNEGELFTVSGDKTVKGRVALKARMGPKKLVLTVNDQVFNGATSGLLKTQPVGRFTVASDPKDPVGDYTSPQVFSGKVVRHGVTVGMAPDGKSRAVVSQTALPPVSEVRRSERPNLVFVIADDCTFRDWGCYGGQAHTPHLDHLATEGMKFERCFQTAPMCSPTRHNLYTGLYPVSSGAWPNHTYAYDQVKSVVHYLQPLGYRVALSGKTHIAPKEVFPFEYSQVGNNPDMKAVERLMVESAQAGNPFCLFACSNEPHSPYNKGDPSRYPPEQVSLAPYQPDTPLMRETKSKYLAEITYFDGQVGEILELLEKHQLADNTLVMVVSEQGDAFPFAKWTCYDNGLQSAMIVRWPGQVKPATVTGAIVEYVDVLPTFIEAAGDEPAAVLQGRSFLPVLRGETDHHKDYSFGLMTTRGIINGSESYPIRSIRSEDYRLVINYQPEAEFSNALTGSDLFDSMREAAGSDANIAGLVGRYERRPAVELYDVRKDPLNMTNLADDPAYADEITGLRAKLEAWLEEQGDDPLQTEMKADQRSVKTLKARNHANSTKL